jgi:hypothetical protein
MAFPVLRLSPSGAPLDELGYTGFQQRFVEANQSCANLSITTTPQAIQNTAAADIVVELPEPSSALNYRARVRYWAARINGTIGSLITHLQVRYTVAGVAGAWATLRNDMVRDETDLQLGKRQVESIVGVDSSFAVPADCELMEVRAAVSASGAGVYELENDGGSGNSGGMVNLTLGELVP